MQSTNEIAYLMTAKFCHDLAAPLGALGMGLECLPENDFAKMLYNSYFLSNFKLRFYRLFMTTNPKGPQICEYVPLLNEFAKAQNINLMWTKPFLDAPELEPIISRALMGFVYTMMEPLVRGGDCTIDLLDDGICISSNGPICPMRDTYKKIFLNDDVDMNGRTIFPYFLMSLLNDGHYNLHFEERPNAFLIKIG